jgi:hypothetical protein
VLVGFAKTTAASPSGICLHKGGMSLTNGLKFNPMDATNRRCATSVNPTPINL